jgi:hypothetical protein
MSHYARVELSLDRGSDPISGELAIGAGSPQRFSGWIELAAAIEAARAESADGAGKSPGGSPGANLRQV